jgi:hypothetical protein
MVKVGSTWGTADRKKFVVLSVVDTEDGHRWVHYRSNNGEEPKEYSCYEESFVSRFSPLPE